MNKYGLTMETVVTFKMKHGEETGPLKDFWNPDNENKIDENQFIESVNAWIQAGRAKINKPIDKAAEIADQIAKELGIVENGEMLYQDIQQRENYNNGSNGYYAKVGFSARTLVEAQEMNQQLIKNFGISQEQIGVEMQNGKVTVTISNCAVKTFARIDRFYAAKKLTGTVTNAVDKTASGLVNTVDIAANTLVVPVAKTAIGTGTKVAKSLFGLGAKLGGILVGETIKATKECSKEIANDAYINIAKGEVVDSIHSVKRAIINKSGSSFGGGQIME